MKKNNNELERLRKILDNMGLRHMKKGGAIYAMFSNDDCPKPLSCLFTAGESKMQAAGYMEGITGVDERRVEGLEFCNQWNNGRVNPRAYLDEDGDWRVNMTLFESERLSDEYIEENFVRLFLSTARQFYKEAAKKFA
jgi:hypothetical protein